MSDATSHRPLRRLVLEKDQAFGFQPWGPNQHWGAFGCTTCPWTEAFDPDSVNLPFMSLMRYTAHVRNPALLSIVPQLSQHCEHENNKTFRDLCLTGQVKLVKAVLLNSAVQIHDRELIQDVVMLQDREMLELLFRYRKNINHDAQGPLSSAATDGRLFLVKLICDHSININAEAPITGQSPLTCAAVKGHNDIVKHLLERSAKVAPYGEPALLEAAKNGFATTAKMLLEHGASAKYYDADGETLLHKAVAARYVELVEIFS